MRVTMRIMSNALNITNTICDYAECDAYLEGAVQVEQIEEGK